MSRRTPVEHAIKDQQKRDQWGARRTVSEAIDACARILGRAAKPDAAEDREAYELVASMCLDEIVPALRSLGDQELLNYGSDLSGHHDWQFDALTTFLYSQPRSVAPDNVHDRRVIEQSFRSLAAIAEHEGVIEDELRSRVDVEGFTVKLGEHLQDWDMNIGDPVHGVALETEALKTLVCGGTGDGKSTTLEREAEDFYQQIAREGSDYKLIDLVDIDKGENWFYDIPQQQPTLRRILKEMGLPADFTEDDDLAAPSVEILLPLAPGLAERQLPYDTEAEQFTTQPFTVPASTLPKRILVPCIMSRLSDDQEQTVRQAYDDVNRQKSDWSLKDLAEEIRSRDELSPKHKTDAIGVLRSLQDLGFIRTAECPHTLAWRDLFKNTETITIFSQALLDSELGKFICIAYLVDRILDLRQDLYSLPDAVLLMRELWEVTPQRGRLSPDERAAAVQEALANRMGKVMRKLRHFDLHLIADTQEPGDLHKQVREMFNRYVVFQSNRDTVDDIFSWTSNDRRGSFWGTLNQKKGQAGIIGKVEPAVQERDIEFLSPVAYAPPSHHHYDKARDTNGWRTRTSYLDHEELRRPVDVAGVEWDDTVPRSLEIGEQRDEDAPDVRMQPVAAFAHECLQPSSDDEYVFTERARDTFNAFLEHHGREPWDFSNQSKVTAFGKRLRDHYPDDTFERRKRSHNGERPTAYVGLTLSQKGRRLLE